MRHATDVSSTCHHCGEVGSAASGIIVGAWVVCVSCGRPRRRPVVGKARRGGWARLWLVPFMVLALTTSLAAQAEPPRALVVTAENLMSGDARHQALVAQGSDAATALPGDILLYRLRFTNVTQGEVRGVVFNNPVPQGMRYVGGSAGADRQDVIAEYSIDGGKTYSARPMVSEVVAGKRVQKPAAPELYSHVRWTVRGSIAPGASVTAEFRAALPAAQPKDSSSH
jgi:uncharacterized repeat protein (TIGR01451 family)